MGKMDKNNYENLLLKTQKWELYYKQKEFPAIIKSEQMDDYCERSHNMSKNTCADCAYCIVDQFDGRSFPCDFDGRRVTKDSYQSMCSHFRKPLFYDKNTAYGYQTFYKKTGWPKPY